MKWNIMAVLLKLYLKINDICWNTFALGKRVATFGKEELGILTLPSKLSARTKELRFVLNFESWRTNSS